MEVACHQDIKQGPAYIHSNISDELKDYAIGTQKVNYNSGHKNKSVVIEVMDPELLELTSGVVRGMSGSLVTQDGKLAGVVTHVFMQGANRGYGILIENMMKQ